MKACFGTKNLKHVTRARWLIALAAAATFGCASSASEQRRVAVMDFENQLTEEHMAPMSRSMASVVHSTLVNQQAVFVVDSEDVDNKLGAPGSSPGFWGRFRSKPKGNRGIAKRLDVDYLVNGKIFRIQDNFVLSAELYSAATGEIVPGTSVTRSCKLEEDLFPCAEAIGVYMAYQIGSFAERARLMEMGRQQSESGTTMPLPPGGAP